MHAILHLRCDQAHHPGMPAWIEQGERRRQGVGQRQSLHQGVRLLDHFLLPAATLGIDPVKYRSQFARAYGVIAK